MNKYHRILTNAAKVADLDCEPIPRMPLVEISGNNRVLIENHKGVLQLGLTQIGVKVNYGIINVTGTCLTILRMTKDQLIISGTVENVQLCNGRQI